MSPTEGARAGVAESDPLAVLEVIDRLEVGPVRLEKNGLTMPYTVHRNGQSSSTELAYRFEEDVFDPDQPASRNLASLIGAQVALNYGLFCHEIVFHGPFDATDRGFLTEMATNTAREIYVKKFLQPNPFLQGVALGLPVVRRRSYLHATLTFPDLERRERGPGGKDDWPQDASRIAVLSSGGKDSLLSYGILRELGLETHSVFVNESGRHWHTAINGFRYLREHNPAETARVWTTSDRVFSWMLRHLPFVREDFARVRADEYPIRLWTVAVFVFGALPVLRRRGIGRLVIGDEFDTTNRTSHQGVTHYDGLFDQSRYFDDALSRYFRRKRWPLVQFSMLRPLSELLIQKTLVERYPELRRLQMSCHAAHLENERALPCGKCEKCRRIVAMLLALGADPRASGYTEEQIQGCIEDLPKKGVRQEAAGAAQLTWMLIDKGILTDGGPGLGQGRRRSEVTKLRFDESASPPNVVPLDLRRRVLPLLLEHAEGAVRRSGRSWIDFDARTDPWLYAPDRHASRMTADADASQEAASGSRGPLLGELTWVTAKELLSRVDTALLPVGAIEQHGPHLPLDTDAWDAEFLCRRVAESCSDPQPLVLPLVPYGVSYHHDSFAGTISVGPDTLANFIYDIGMAVARHGITKLIIVNGHGGNAPTLQLAAQKINRDAHIFTCVDTGETSDADIALLTESANDVHAGEVETSTALATRPQLVDMSKAEAAVPQFSNQYLDFASSQAVEWYEHTARISPSGVLGDPTKATVEKGELIWKLMIDHLVQFVETLKGLTLDEIYERRH